MILKDHLEHFILKGLSRVIKLPKPVVLFAPVMRGERLNLPIHLSRCLPWDYFKWHHALVDYFATRKDYIFIWKALLQRFGRGDTIAKVIEAKGSDNIIFRTDKLLMWLYFAERAICDEPSAAFFECVFAGVPVLGLYRPRDQKLRESVFLKTRNILPYSSIDEGIETIDDFLSSPAEACIASRGYLL